MSVILVVVPDVPWPSTHGGRLAVARELEMLIALGHQVRLLCLSRERLDIDQIPVHLRGAVEVRSIERRSMAAATMRAPHLPYAASSRLIKRRDLGELKSWARNCDMSVVVGEYCLPALKTAGFSSPHVVRSHNVEDTYFAALMRSESLGAKKLARWVEWKRLAAAYQRWLVTADEVWAIADEDRDVFRLRGATAVTMPPILGGLRGCRPQRLRHSLEPFNVLFAGNLYMPNNLLGLEWLVAKVWPQVVASAPQAMLTIAGSRPSKRLLHLVAGVPSILLVPDPSESQMAEIHTSAVVFVNPVLEGAGVSMKLAAVFEEAIPLVSTTQGLRGLQTLGPDGSLIGGADTAADFAASLVSLVDKRAWTIASAASGQLAYLHSFSVLLPGYENGVDRVLKSQRNPTA